MISRPSAELALVMHSGLGMQTPAPGIRRDHEVLTRRFMITEDYRPSAVQPSAIMDACRPARWVDGEQPMFAGGGPVSLHRASAVIMSSAVAEPGGRGCCRCLLAVVPAGILGRLSWSCAVAGAFQRRFSARA
jgi:hypothetical protein